MYLDYLHVFVFNLKMFILVNWSADLLSFSLICCLIEASICVFALHRKDTFGRGFIEQSWTDPLNMLLNISDSTDQISNECQSGSYRSQAVTSHQIKVT